MTKSLFVTILASTLAVAELPQEYPGLLVSADWLSDHLADPEVAVLHAGMQKGRYEAGHIPGAHFFDLNQIIWEGEPAWGTEMRSFSEISDALEMAGVSTGQKIILYSSNPLFAARAFMTLEVLGLRGSVSMLDGGFGGWQEDGREVSIESPMFDRGSIFLEAQDDILVSADWIHQRLADPTIALVDARPDDEYTGEDGGLGGTAHPGHIPGAAQMYWEELVVSRQSPTVQGLDRLTELFMSAGAEAGDTVVAYCMVGWRASFTYFAARLLGYETKFYDGSWRDWGTREDLPYVSGRSRR